MACSPCFTPPDSRPQRFRGAAKVSPRRAAAFHLVAATAPPPSAHVARRGLRRPTSNPRVRQFSASDAPALPVPPHLRPARSCLVLIASSTSLLKRAMRRDSFNAIGLAACRRHKAVSSDCAPSPFSAAVAPGTCVRPVAGSHDVHITAAGSGTSADAFRVACTTFPALGLIGRDYSSPTPCAVKVFAHDGLRAVAVPPLTCSGGAAGGRSAC